jgi:tetratricopeptide (TPR) repeat protein
VCGPGGMGKSALAAQAVHQLEASRFPDGIVFHSFYHQASTEMALQTIAGAFHIEAKAGLESAVRQALSGRKALLILDGTEEADDLPAVLRLRSTCGVLITSRRNEDALDAPWELKPLEDEEAEAVLLRYSGPVDDIASAQAICALLKGWPVALRIAGRYLRNKKESAATYLRWLEKKPFKMLGSGTHQEDNMALLLERSVAQVSADAVQALRLTGVLAFAPIGLGPVMAVLYKEGEEQDELELRSSYALGELVSFGLMEKGVKCWQIHHALFHTYARQELPLSKDTLERLVGAYVSFCRTQSEAGVKGYARLDAERAHCLRLMDSCLARELWNEVQYMENAIDSYLHRQGYWAGQLTALGMRLTAAQQAGNRKGEAWCLNSLGQTYDNYREHQKALSCYEQSLKIYRALGDRVGESTTLHNISNYLPATGQIRAGLGALSAKPEHTLRDRRSKGGRRDPEYYRSALL